MGQHKAPDFWCQTLPFRCYQVNTARVPVSWMVVIGLLVNDDVCLSCSVARRVEWCQGTLVPPGQSSVLVYAPVECEAISCFVIVDVCMLSNSHAFVFLSCCSSITMLQYKRQPAESLF